MKKLLTLIITIGVAALSTQAQQIKFWKNNVCVKQMSASEVDYITFEEDTPTPPDNYTLSDLTGTWVITHSKGTKEENGNVTTSWDKDVELDFNCIVIGDDKTYAFMESSLDNDIWNEDGTGTFDIVNGKPVVTGGYISEFAITAYGNDVMIIQYAYKEDATNRTKRYTDTMKRVSKRTDVLKTTTNNNPARWETLPYISAGELVGTWLICNDKHKNETDNVVINENVEAEKNYYVIFHDKLGFIEYSDQSEKWHLDSGEYYNYTVSDGQFCMPYAHLIEYDGADSAKIFVVYTEDKGSYTNAETHIYTIRRVSEKTDYITYDE